MTSSAAHYAGIVRDKADQRRAIQIAEEVPERIGEAEDPASLMVSAGQRLVALGRGAAMESKWVWASEVAQRAFEAIDGHQREQAPGVQMVKIDCGIPGLETYTTELRLIGARTSVGKTAFAHQLLLNAGQAGIAAGFITMETMASRLGCGAWAASAASTSSGWCTCSTSRRSRHERPRRWRADGGVSPGQPMSITPPGRLLRSRRRHRGPDRRAHRARAGKVRMLYFHHRLRPDAPRPSPHAEGAATRAAVATRGDRVEAGSPKSWAWATDLPSRSPEVDPEGADKRPQMYDVKDCSTLSRLGRLRRYSFREGYAPTGRRQRPALARPLPNESDLPVEIRRHAGGGDREATEITGGRAHGRLDRFSEFQRFERLADPWAEWR